MSPALKWIDQEDDTVDLGARVADPQFWFDRYSIPQYDLLVTQGVVTREQADEYRQQRAAEGLPMTFDELEPRPEPVLENFLWLLEVDGPAIDHDRQTIDVDGQEWYARDVGSHGYLYSHIQTSEPDGWHGLDLHKASAALPTDPVKVRWEASFRVAKDVFASVSGVADTFAAAAAQAKAVDFAPEVWNGHLLYPNDNGDGGKILVLDDGSKLSVRPSATQGDFYWERWLPESSPFAPLLKPLGRFYGNLSGSASTRDEALAAGISVLATVWECAVQLVGNADAFEAGKAAGRAELKSAIAAL